MVDVRIITSAKDCLDVEVFSNIDKLISYTGYPDMDIIEKTIVIDENGSLYEANVENATLSYSASMLTSDEISRIASRITEYLKTQGIDDSRIKDYDLGKLADEVVSFRGITY